ncbi:MAG: thioredoxin family protein [Erysipelotrichaceae bacterium]|jgi:glutaredoxin|uniref:Thioredoxin family protein n=1 Tax=Grylomicrobium aquisgranensis TaxID=2926318 RepID=A0AB35U728_9FIRM|nr:thioredoxin family protein [Lactimicrobium massiliense]MCH4021541.1 thioredoxin family protein [Erysipelotrichaceae bacterium]MCI1326830.1 thioredoxin family protein [Solobacterium sp.]MDX8419732.1 thioredoxin family protein [Stecheria sp. CLA-KB-P133]MCH4043455.1 thioredoxin family protein [Erysipelotrichaceae bacterium]MCH4120678.1 thioredoxin family protein [Erysipelotrichaceae bacterium]
MQKVMYFHLDTCPYCRQADEVIQELIQEHPEYAKVQFEKVDEYEHPEIADQYDYMANPSMFIGHEKLYEAHIGEKKAETREKVEKVLKRALED